VGLVRRGENGKACRHDTESDKLLSVSYNKPFFDGPSQLNTATFFLGMKPKSCVSMVED